MEKFHMSTQQAEEYVNQARDVLWKDLDNITPSKCTELAEQCQVHYQILSGDGNHYFLYCMQGKLFII